MRRLFLGLLLALFGLHAQAATTYNSFAAIHPGIYNPATVRIGGVKYQFPGGISATPIVTDPNNGGTIWQQHCTSATPFPSGGWTQGYVAAYQDGTGEHALPNTITYANGKIDYPPGTETAITFNSGQTSVTITPGTEGSPAGTEVRTDPIAVTIPAYTCFIERFYVTVPAAGYLPEAQRNSQTGNGEGFVSGSDQTNTTAQLAGAVNIWMMGATDALVSSNKPAACIVPADSIAAGAGDTATSSGVDNLVGYIERGLNNYVAWQNLGRSSNRLQFWLSNNAFQSITTGPTTAHCTSIILEAGTNDEYANNLTLSQLQALFLSVANQWDANGVYVYATTLLPRVACSPDCSTLANQTPYAGNETVREAYNAWLLAGVTLNSGRTVTVWDIASIAQDTSVPDPSRWRVDLGNPSSEGIHPNVNLTPTLASGVQWWKLK